MQQQNNITSDQQKETTSGHAQGAVRKPVLGVSECLLGKEVRYNGGHKHSRYLTAVLSQYFDFRPICPEVQIGMTVPRPPVRLAQINDKIRVIATDQPETDYSDALRGLAIEVAPSMRDLSGFIFMQKSPSCGVKSTKVYGEKGQPLFMGDGAFSSELMQQLPLMPVTEIGRVNDSPIRENFISAVYAYFDWQTNVSEHLSAKSLIDFHHRHKLMLAAHNEKVAKHLGRLLSQLKGQTLEHIAHHYITEFMNAMKLPVSRKRHASILVRMQRYLKRKLDQSEKKELNGLIEHYKKGLVPLVVPMTLVRFFMKKYQEHEALKVLDKYPMELGLENTI